MPENMKNKNTAIAFIECCVCGKRIGSKLVDRNELYEELLEKYGKVVSHTYCAQCADDLRKEYGNYKAERENSSTKADAGHASTVQN
jgi:hypothetical protein